MTQEEKYPFDKKVRAMSFRQIVEAMVRGLRHRHVTVCMSTFGSYDHGICYGCAATNAICEISGVKFTRDTIYSKAEAVNASRAFMDDFEYAIDYLRRGSVYNAMNVLLSMDCDAPTSYYEPGPFLGDSVDERDLQAWEQSVAHLPEERP